MRAVIPGTFLFFGNGMWMRGRCDTAGNFQSDIYGCLRRVQRVIWMLIKNGRGRCISDPCKCLRLRLCGGILRGTIHILIGE